MNGTPACPTPQQCSDKARVEIPGSDTRAHAVWWPQMGGYTGKAVVTITDCADLWLWHDGQFPIKDDQAPREIHLCDPRQWIDVFQWLKDEVDREIGDEVEPDRWDLPEGVTLEEAQEVYRKVIDWGLMEDPRGTEIRTYDQRMSVRMPCDPVPCPPFLPHDLKLEPLRPNRYAPLPARIAERFMPEGGAPRDPWIDTVRDHMPLLFEISPQEMERLLMTGVIHPGPGIDVSGPPVLGPAGSGAGEFLWADFTVHEDGRVTSRRWTPMDLTAPVVSATAVRDGADEENARRWRLAGLADERLTARDTGAPLPMIVGVPENDDPVALADAIAICQRLGLLPETPGGLLFVPEGTELPEEA